MATVTKSADIGADPEAVWEVLADFGGMARWVGFVDHSSIQRGAPLEVGTARRVQIGPLALLERITDVDASRLLEYELEGLPGVVSSVRNRWDVARGPAGAAVSIATTVRIGATVLTVSPFFVAERLLGEVLANRSVVMLDGLAQHLESAHA